MEDITKLVKFLDAVDVYDSAMRLVALVGKDKFISAMNGNANALNELGNKLIEQSKLIKNGPIKVKDSNFLKNLSKLKDK